MEVGENRVRVFYGTEKREMKKDSRYIQKSSAPAAGPCIRPVTSCTSVTGVLHVYLHREPQVRLICSWCMKICLRSAARISAERLISV
jgi:hypothetical protein